MNTKTKKQPQTWVTQNPRRDIYSRCFNNCFNNSIQAFPLVVRCFGDAFQNNIFPPKINVLPNGCLPACWSRQRNGFICCGTAVLKTTPLIFVCRPGLPLVNKAKRQQRRAETTKVTSLRNSLFSLACRHPNTLLLPGLEDATTPLRGLPIVSETEPVSCCWVRKINIFRLFGDT